MSEFFGFNTKSQLQLLSTKGIFMMEREVYDEYLVKLYLVYNFLVEVIVDRKACKVLRVDPVLNESIIEIYHRS